MSEEEETNKIGIQDKPGRLVAIVSKQYTNGCYMPSWGIEATYDVKSWTQMGTVSVPFPEGTIGTDVKGPFLLDSMKEMKNAYPKPFIHLVIVGQNTYYISETFLVDAYEYMKMEKPA